MTFRPRLARSVPFWILVAGSLAAVVGGGWIALTRLATMVTALNANTATTADVYGGQSWIVVGAVLLGAGLVGLVVVLSLAVVRSLLSAHAADEAAPVDEIAVASDDLPFVEDVPEDGVGIDAPSAQAGDTAEPADAEPADAEPADAEAAR